MGGGKIEDTYDEIIKGSCFIGANVPNTDVLSDALLIDLTNPTGESNKISKVSMNSTANLPEKIAWGVREVLYLSPKSVIIRIIGVESDGNTYCSWINIYNHGLWIGWKRLLNFEDIYRKTKLNNSSIVINNVSSTNALSLNESIRNFNELAIQSNFGGSTIYGTEIRIPVDFLISKDEYKYSYVQSSTHNYQYTFKPNTSDYTKILFSRTVNGWSADTVSYLSIYGVGRK